MFNKLQGAYRYVPDRKGEQRQQFMQCEPFMRKLKLMLSILLVDATNAFNTMNRKVMLHNIG